MPAHRTLPRPSMSLLTLAALLFAALPARAQDAPPLPAEAVNENVAVAIWLDAAQFTPDAVRAAAERLNDELPEQQRANAQQLDQRLDESLADFEQMHAALTGAGVEGALVLVQTTANDAEPAPDPAVLLRTTADTTAEDLRNAIQQVDQAQPEQPSDFARYGDRWFIDAEQQGNIPTDGTDEQANQVRELFGRTDNTPVRLAFRMTPNLKQQLQQQAEAAAGGLGADLVNAAQALSDGWASLSFGNNPNFTPNLRFDTAGDAEQFNTAWNDLLAQLQQQLVQFSQMMNDPNNPQQNQIKPEAIQGIVDALRLQQAENTLTGEIGGQFIAHAGELGPLLQQMAMMMMMGGQQGGMGGPGPAPQPQGPPRN